MPAHARAAIPRRAACILLPHLFAVLLALRPAAGAEAPKVRFDLPSDRAEVALKLLAQQSGLEILFPTDAVAGIRTNAVQGEMTARQALDAMLAGTALVAIEGRNTASLSVRRKDNETSSAAEPPSGPLKKNESGTEQTQPPMKRNRFSFLTQVVTTLALWAAPAGAQTAPAPISAGPVADETITLSPFEVNAAADKGYRATNTLDGSRLNTALRDTPGAISVFTRDLLDDLGATNISEMLRYDVNADDGGFGDDSFGAGVGQQGNMSDFGAAEWRIRGLPASTSTNGFATTGKFDTYNVETAGSTRGPNAILFGSGAAGGVLNLRTKQANPIRHSNSLEFKLGDDSLRRASADFNRVLIKNKLALRAMGMVEHRGHPMPHKQTDKESITLATQWRITKVTGLNVSYENTRTEGIGGRPFNPTDSISLFLQELQAGRVVWSAARERYETLSGAVVAAAAGVGNLAPRTVLVQGPDLGPPVLWEGATATANRATLSTTASRWTGTKPILDESFMRFGSVMAGGEAEYGVVKFRNFTATLTHSFTDKLHMELAFNKSIRDSDGNISQGADIRADLNYRLPDGSLNPYFFGNGYYFVNGTYIRQTQGYDDKTMRASFSYEAGSTKRWWGEHRFAALLERHINHNQSYRTRQVWAGAPFGGAPEAAANQVNWRRYFKIDGPLANYTIGYNPAGPFTTTTVTSANVAGRTLNTAWVANNNLNYDDDIVTDSGLFVMQNFLFNRRLVITTGLRRDKIDTESPNTIRDAATQEFRYATPEDQPSFERTGGSWVETTHEKGGRKSLGAVLHATQNFSLTANFSNGVGINRRNRTVLPEQRVPDASKGEGRDYGINFSFLDNRLAGSIKKYKSQSIGEGGQGLVENVFVNPNNDVMASFDYYFRQAGLTTFGGGDPIKSIDELRGVYFSGANGYLSDRVSTGYEFELIANPTQNWTIRANYSYTDRTRTNVLTEGDGWWAQRVELWEQLDRLYITRTGRPSVYNELLYNRNDALTNQTVASRIADSERELSSVRFQEQQGYGNRKHKANLWGRYTVPSGTLRGLTLGGGWRYQSANIAGIDLVSRSVFYGNPRSLFDGMAAYTTKGFFGRMGDKLRVTYQLNITNLLDDRTINILKIGTDTVSNVPYLRLATREDPRNSTLTVRVAF